LGEAKVSRFTRLYLFPGGSHCSGGDGPFDFPLLSLIMNWVENGAAPEAIVASHSQGRGGPVDATRPVYPYPMAAVYKGSGDIKAAASYEGKPGPKVDPARLVWEGSAFYTPASKK
jgi:feruloyl esterase